MKKPIFKGVCTALVTPFLDDKINYPLLEQLLKRQMDAGISAVVLSGTTGESPALSDSEKIQMIRRSKEYTGNHCTIIAGTGSNSTTHTIELSIKAEEAGADALLVVSPYYNKGNPDGLVKHFTSIAQSVRIPIILYNVPSRTGIDVPVSVYEKLASESNIVGVKEASTDITKITRIRRCCGDDFSIWSGNDDHIVPAISLGAVGVISVLSNLFPEETVAMTTAALASNFGVASALQCRLSHIIELLFSEVNPIPIKYAMRYAGYDCGNCRLPLGQISDHIKAQLDAYF